MTGILEIVGLLVLATVATMLCAGINPLTTLRKTFLPMTKKEFWFPPCPFCWVARGAAVLLIGVLAPLAF